MPIHKRTFISQSEVIIWHITEEEAYFTEHSGLVSNKIHLKKRLEFLSSRYCLKLLLPQLKYEDILKDGDGKPYLMNNAIHISISHSYPYVAVAVHPSLPIGIDIQTIQEKILRLQSKFLSTFEMALCNNDIYNITTAWCCKEAMYKKYALGGLDFKENMPIVALDKYLGKSAINFRHKDTKYLQQFYIESNEHYAMAITI
jgi:4'-phosphopantetheinyl transferase